VRDLVHQASAVAAFTGAGISAESGIPIFPRSGGHLAQLPGGNLATPGAFAKDSKLVWEWYNFRRSVIAGVEPNAGHRALAGFERRKKDFTLITQNVDRLRERAGSRNLLKIHGDIWTLRCTVCARVRHDIATPLPELPPHCACGGMERPGVVWFGESLPDEIWIKAQRSARQSASSVGDRVFGHRLPCR
jgi:NAD-dependent deacetylase